MGTTTTAKRNDGAELPSLLERAAETHSWFKPEYVLADRGYDSVRCHREVLRRGAQPIIPIKNMVKKNQDGLWEGIYTYDGIPICLGKLSMEYVETDPQLGHLYRCPGEGCYLQDRKRVVYCQDTFWLDHSKMDDPRRFPAIRRQSQEWKDLYDRRQSVEPCLQVAEGVAPIGVPLRPQTQADSPAQHHVGPDIPSERGCQTSSGIPTGRNNPLDGAEGGLEAADPLTV